MSVAIVQDFIARYLRDPSSREHVDHSSHTDPGVRALLDSIDLQALHKTALQLDQERIAKRQNEFGPFLAQMGRWTDLEAFYSAYLAAFIDGDLLRRTELDRFYFFACKYVLVQGLPSYLLDLAKRQYHGICLAEDATEPPPGPLHAGRIDLYHQLSLPRPWRRLRFGFDVIAHSFPAATSQPMEALIVRDLQRHKVTHIVPVRPGGVLDIVSSRGGMSVLELIEALQAFNDVPGLVQEISDLRAKNVLWVHEPAGHLARQGH